MKKKKATGIRQQAAGSPELGTRNSEPPPVPARRECHTTQEPPIEHAEPPVQTPDVGDPRYWPADEPIPDVWIKRRRAVPCPACRRVLTDERSQAAVCTWSDREVAYFRCRSCGHRWQLPVREV